VEHPVPAASKGIRVQVFSLRNKGLKRRKQRLRNGVRGGLLALGMAAAASIPAAFVFDGALAWVAAALLLFAGRGLRSHPARGA